MDFFCPQTDPVDLFPSEANPLRINMRNSDPSTSFCGGTSDPPDSTAFPYGFSPINFTYQCYSGGACIISSRPSRTIFYI